MKRQAAPVGRYNSDTPLRLWLARRRRLLLRLFIALAVFMVIAASLGLTAYWARQSSLQQLLNRGDHALQLYVANIRRELSQYEYLPKLLADDSRVLALLRQPQSRQQRHVVDHYLQFVAQASNAAVIYVMTRQGQTIASSNWNEADSFVGANYGFRPYFQQAMQGGLGRYYALGSSSFVRGYYFAYPIRLHGRIVGAVVVKASLNSLEAENHKRHYEFVVTGRHGIAFLSTRPQWRYHAFKPLAPEVLFRVASSQRYVGHALPQLPVVDRAAFNNGAKLLTVGDAQTTYLKHGLHMPELGWWVYILSSTEAVRGYVLRAVILVAVILGALVLAGFILWQRRVRLAERRRYEQATAEAEAALDANRQLTREIEEHRRTEVELRRTRDELVQAGKLAAIGELAAGINHELNQPLTSIRFFADNARTFLERSRLDSVRNNLSQIDMLAGHMGKITHQLKQFARRSSGQPVRVSMNAVVEGAQALLAPRLKREDVILRWQELPEDVYCRGDLVRLEQVAVNLIGNAIQAMSSLPEPCVEVTVVQRDARVELSVRDYGPGMAETYIDQVFDPFFTTKQAGEGLGLGLSISKRIVEEIGGTMQAFNHTEGGAVFAVDLPAAAVTEDNNG